jgi:hypothetical protein
MQSLERQGNMYTQQLEMDRISTLLQGSLGAAASKSAASASKKSSRKGGISSIVSAVAPVLIKGAVASDRRLKKNIKHKFNSPSGVPVYDFEYKDDKYGSGVYQGVMSNEIPQDAVHVNSEGFDTVDYSKLDVEFKKIN